MARNQAFTFDSLQRLLTASGAYGTIGYSYDGVGNRLSRTVDDGVTLKTELYSYAATSNRLLSVDDGTSVRTLSYDTAGHMQSDDRGAGADLGFSHNNAGRMNAKLLAGEADATYDYNAFGERVKKQEVGLIPTASHFHYDRAGQMLGVTDETGAPVEDYIFLDGLLIAQITPAQPGSDGNAIDIVVDNTDEGVSTVGTWVQSTEGEGFEGTDHQNHVQMIPAVPPGGVLIDNSDPGFDLIGSWPVSTSGLHFEGADFVERATGTNPASFVIDNIAAEFSTYGSWSTATYRNDYGANYRRITANMPPPAAIILDNTHASFSADPSWSSTSTRSWGSNAMLHAANGPPPGSVIVDNVDAEVEVIGSWILTTEGADKYGANHYYKSGGDGSAKIIWRPAIPVADTYRVYARWPRNGPGLPNTARYTVYHAGGETAMTRNIQQGHNSGVWKLLGTFDLAPGQDHRVEISDQGSSSNTIFADAVYIVPASTPHNTATWSLPVTDAGSYNLYTRYKNNLISGASDAPFTIFHDAGETTVDINQYTVGNSWRLLGTFDLDPAQNPRIELTDDANGYVYADVVYALKVGDEAPARADWTPDFASRGYGRDYYVVYGWWPKTIQHAKGVQYRIEHEGGTYATSRSQYYSGASWKNLGTFLMAPGQGHRASVLGLASQNKPLAADAMRFTPHGTIERFASWSLPISGPISQTGSHDIYVKWVPGAGRAVDARYVVEHANGSTDVTVDQSAGFGFWHKLGSFDFAPGGDNRVRLSDQGSGSVVADAVYVVPTPAPLPPGPAPSFTWTADIPASGDYEIFVKYQASPDRTGAATYSITHADGTADVTLDQTQNGGIWVSLGTHAFGDGASASVTLTASDGGSVSADAVRFVGEGAAPGNIAYLHTDHLGTPMKMTDNAGQIVWDRQQTPFGITHSETGSKSTNIRMPGQWSDAETGLSYNWFRDYDPTLGRYVQSDPIGLRGGLNTYAYVGGNPGKWIDPLGLACKTILSFVVPDPFISKISERPAGEGPWFLTSVDYEISISVSRIPKRGTPTGAGGVALCAAMKSIFAEISYQRQGTKHEVGYCTTDCGLDWWSRTSSVVIDQWKETEVVDRQTDSAIFPIAGAARILADIACSNWLIALNGR